MNTEDNNIDWESALPDNYLDDELVDKDKGEYKAIIKEKEICLDTSNRDIQIKSRIDDPWEASAHAVAHTLGLAKHKSHMGQKALSINRERGNRQAVLDHLNLHTQHAVAFSQLRETNLKLAYAHQKAASRHKEAEQMHRKIMLTEQQDTKET